MNIQDRRKLLTSASNEMIFNLAVSTASIIFIIYEMAHQDIVRFWP